MAKVKKMRFRLGYNTNGFISHSLESALEIIARLGYSSVAITLDHHALNPWQPNLDEEIEAVKEVLKRYALTCVIETGARFLLDPLFKHAPTLISNDAERRKLRLDFLKKAMDIAARLNAAALSFWSGKKPEDMDAMQAWYWLISGCRELAAYAANQENSIPMAFEPEPGMFVENLCGYRKLKKEISSDLFGLTLDLGHVFMTEDMSVGDCIRQYRHDIYNIHIEDMKKEVHEHLFFGEGDIEFADIFQALNDIGYTGPVNVELSRHSHMAPETAGKAIAFLKKFTE